MDPKSRIQITLSPFDRALEIISSLALILMWAFTLATVFLSPAVVPAHFNSAGQPDDYSGRASLILLPLLGTLIMGLIILLMKFPHIFNPIKQVNDTHVPEQYVNALRMLRVLKFSIAVIFSVLVIQIFLVARGILLGLGIGFLPFVLGMIMIPQVYFIIRALRA